MELKSYVRRTASGLFPHAREFEGAHGSALFIGYTPYAPSIAKYVCGDDVQLVSKRRVSRRLISGRLRNHLSGEAGTLFVHDDVMRAVDENLAHHCILVPEQVAIYRDLPKNREDLLEGLRTSTTREDLRRIRRAGFEFRVTTQPDDVREFHSHHYLPLIKQQYPDDGQVLSVGEMIAKIDRGGELVCADIDGRWVAGIMNEAGNTEYALTRLGILNADSEVRKKRVSSALIVKSLERAVERGYSTATLGKSLPFLGKGPVWFKAKWGGKLRYRDDSRILHVPLNLAAAEMRTLLSKTPIVHIDNQDLVASIWLRPGEQHLTELLRESSRIQGIVRWLVYGDSETLAIASKLLEPRANLVTIAVPTANKANSAVN